jgi:hypothetical protein
MSKSHTLKANIRWKFDPLENATHPNPLCSHTRAHGSAGTVPLLRRSWDKFGFSFTLQQASSSFVAVIWVAWLQVTLFLRNSVIRYLHSWGKFGFFFTHCYRLMVLTLALGHNFLAIITIPHRTSRSPSMTGPPFPIDLQTYGMTLGDRLTRGMRY